MSESIKQELQEVIDDLCGQEKFDPAHSEIPLVEAGLDSLDYVSVVMALEDKYGFEIPQTSDSELWTLNDLISFIKTNVRES